MLSAVCSFGSVKVLHRVEYVIGILLQKDIYKFTRMRVGSLITYC